jgi:rSAM/selenodomain-associated transferase 2
MRISVVIPTLTEALTVRRAISSAQETLDPWEVIVVDAGSRDGTADMAIRAGARVLHTPGSRAAAMNAGARIASGDVLLFLHADTTLPAGAGTAVRAALRGCDGGAFHLAYDDRRPLMRAFDEIRLRLAGPVYGDQAIFVTRAAFDRLGGYRALAIMEDYDLVRRLRRTGRFSLVPLSVETAARRHRHHGTVRTLMRMWTIQCLYRMGISPARLARLYPPTR